LLSLSISETFLSVRNANGERTSMKRHKLVATATVLAVALGGGVSVALAAAPKSATIKESTSLKFKANRYIQDGLRWDKDVYDVKSGGTLHVKFNVKNEGPHTFTVVRKKDVPSTAKEVESCKICNKLGKAHGADPSTDAPPKFVFLENGKGQNTPPNVDQPGDSAGIGFGADPINLKVTAKKGTTLHFICLIHPWMQAVVKVG
jgi:hypothetical protein